MMGFCRSDTRDLRGLSFGLWTVESYAGPRNGAAWICVCRCGVRKVVLARSLQTGRSRSCGCTRPKGSQWTPEQHRAAKRKWRQARPDYRAKESKRWREADPVRFKQRHREHNYRAKYGLELHQVEQLLRDQGGKCAICFTDIVLGGKAGAKVDHCHKTNRVRGVLCSRCNTALGSFRDDIEILASAIRYLSKSVVTVSSDSS